MLQPELLSKVVTCYFLSITNIVQMSLVLLEDSDILVENEENYKKITR